jgi:methylmalonyl-CoA/ethylmalonyl-CoA epimerase
MMSGAAEEKAIAAELKEVPGFQFIDHFAISVPQGQLDGQVASYELLEIGGGPNLIQLLEPLSAESPVQKLIEKNGGRGGFAHVAFRVKSAQKAFEYMKAKNFNIIDAAPRPGSRGTTVFFVHPKAFGFLIEIVEEKK